MNVLTQVLYWLATGMLVPVIVLLLAAFGYALLLVGDMYGLYAARLRMAEPLRVLLERLRGEPVRAVSLADALPQGSLLRVYGLQAQECGWHAVHCEKILRDFERHCQRELEGARILMRVGPMLGLMGTLIPMGPALVSLAAGDLSSMAVNMQVAFSTTVIGLFVGAVGYVVYLVKRRWYPADVQALEFMVDLALEQAPQPEKELVYA